MRARRLPEARPMNCTVRTRFATSNTAPVSGSSVMVSGVRRRQQRVSVIMEGEVCNAHALLGLGWTRPAAAVSGTVVPLAPGDAPLEPAAGVAHVTEPGRTAPTMQARRP